MAYLTPIALVPAFSTALFLAGCDDFRGSHPMQPQNRRDESALQEKVDRAFEAARRGAFAGIADLEKLGPPVVPLLAPYVEDPDPNLRREAVALLQTMGGRETLPPLLKALGDPDHDIQARAALALYLHNPPADVVKADDAETRLRASVEAGNRAAAAILLLVTVLSTWGFYLAAGEQADAEHLRENIRRVLSDLFDAEQRPDDVLVDAAREQKAEIFLHLLEDLGFTHPGISDRLAQLLTELDETRHGPFLCTLLETLRRLGASSPAVLKAVERKRRSKVPGIAAAAEAALRALQQPQASPE